MKLLNPTYYLISGPYATLLQPILVNKKQRDELVDFYDMIVLSRAEYIAEMDKLEEL